MKPAVKPAVKPARRIRVLSVAAVRRDDGAVLVQRGTDPADGSVFHRLIGGGVDVGESVAEAVVREWDEELDARLHDVRLLGWLENRFELGGRAGHEVVAVHVGRVSEPRVLDRDDLGHIPGSSSTVHWVSPDVLLDGQVPLYPTGLAALLGPWLAEQR
jgi:ADP-ribose pyrophosphatase YjhB (NUDIX family)